jgi:hypothetical protein
MKRFIEGADREQSTPLPESLDDWIDDSNPVRAVDVFVAGLNLIKLGFSGVVPEATGRPSYHPSALLANSVGGRVRSSVFVVLRSITSSIFGAGTRARLLVLRFKNARCLSTNEPMAS